MTIENILNQVDLGSYALPEFQRGYVWNRDQVKKLMMSLYRGYPIGGLLIWVTPTDASITRGDGHLTPGVVNLILDGQQRVTSLYGIIRGKAPKFFEGNASSFTGLYFNLEEETFEFYMPLKMKDNPLWISVTELLQMGASNFIQKSSNPAAYFNYLGVLNKLDNIKHIDLHIQEVTGEDKTIDVVVEIFNNVNSGGTKLSKGDLALAKVCGQWSEARSEMRRILASLQSAGYRFSLEWLLRCVTIHLTGRPYFSELEKVSTLTFQQGLQETEKLIGVCLNHIGSRLGLDHDRVLGSRFAIATMIGYIRQRGTHKLPETEWDKLLYWYTHTMLWGRYAGSTESVMAQDLNEIANGSGIEGLIRMLRVQRGSLELKPDDFWGWSSGARFYPLLYMLTRVNHAKDFGTGVELSHHLLGKNSSLEVHHIFPKDQLYRRNYRKSIVNSLANYAFITKETNLDISNKEPKEYFPVYCKLHPGALESHSIPTNDPELLELDNYEKFLEKRRCLLAQTANTFLESLYNGTREQIVIDDYANRNVADEVISDEETIIAELAYWMEEKGLSSGERNYRLVDEDTQQEAIVDLAWPDGIQSGLSSPIAVLIDEPIEVQKFVNNKGYLFFTGVDEFKQYIIVNYIGMD